MRKVAIAVSAFALGAVGVGIGTVASPAWADDAPSAESAAAGCGVRGYVPTVSGRQIAGRAGRGGCSDSVLYLWSRVKRDINNWPDATHAESSKNHVVNSYVDARGGCGKRALYYTEASTSGGPFSEYNESPHQWRC